MRTPSIPEIMTTVMLIEFGRQGTEDTIENRLSFLETMNEIRKTDPVFGHPSNVLSHIALTMLINELKVDQVIQQKAI
jgi:hypothetical protein